MNGTANFFVEQPIGQPYLTIEIDREALASFGLNVNDVQAVIEAGIGGQVAGQVYEGQRRFDIQVRYPYEFRSELQKIQEIPVPLPNGEFIPIKRVSRIVAQEGPREISAWKTAGGGLSWASTLKTSILALMWLNCSRLFLQKETCLRDIFSNTAELLKTKNAP